MLSRSILAQKGQAGHIVKFVPQIDLSYSEISPTCLILSNMRPCKLMRHNLRKKLARAGYLQASGLPASDLCWNGNSLQLRGHAAAHVLRLENFDLRTQTAQQRP